MKQILALAFLFFGLFLSGNAQSNSKKAKDSIAAAAKTAKSTGTNKDGSPDMRLKKNKDSVKAAMNKPVPPPPVVSKPVAPATTATTPKTTTPAVNPPNKSADKVVGTDDKGRTIYEGPRGGRYYINKNGNKEYVKKS